MGSGYPAPTASKLDSGTRQFALDSPLGIFYLVTALTIIAIAITALVLVFAIECAAALLPSRATRAHDDSPRPPLAVLVPAHDEESGLVATLTLLKRQLAPHDELLVIADNCTDRTAEIARGLGATVLERVNNTERGKGFAVQAGLAELRTRPTPPAVVLLFDADCQPQAGCVEVLARMALATDRPGQAKYLMVRPAGGSPRQLISQFAVTVKNFVRLRGLKRLGLPCLLTGSGIALPWRIANALPLAGGHIVEDMQLTFDLLLRGESPLFCEQAVVISALPTGAEQRRPAHPLGTWPPASPHPHGAAPRLGSSQTAPPHARADGARPRRAAVVTAGACLVRDVAACSSRSAQRFAGTVAAAHRCRRRPRRRGADELVALCASRRAPHRLVDRPSLRRCESAHVRPLPRPPRTPLDSHRSQLTIRMSTLLEPADAPAEVAAPRAARDSQLETKQLAVAYLVNQYPQTSVSFVRREIAGLERAGAKVLRFSIRQWNEALVDPRDQAEETITRRLLDGGPLKLLAAAASRLSAHPTKLCRAALLAAQLGRRSDRGLATHAIYFLEACRLAQWCRASGVDWLHAHFGTNSATVALLCRALGGPPFSFTVHGPEEFDRPELLKLRKKSPEPSSSSG